MWPEGCPEGIPEGFMEAVRRDVIEEDAYIVFERGGAKAVCNWCGNDVGTPESRNHWRLICSQMKWKRNRESRNNGFYRTDEAGTCPTCGHFVKTIMRGGTAWEAQNYRDVACIQVAGDEVWIKLFTLRRDPENRKEMVTEKNLTPAFCWHIFGHNVQKWEFNTTEWEYQGGKWKPVYKPRWWSTGCVTKTAGAYYIWLPEGLNQQLAGTPLQYADPESWRAKVFEKANNNIIRYLVDFPRFEAVEKLRKAGYSAIISQKDDGMEAGYGYKGMINWHAKTVEKALRLPLWVLKKKRPEEWSYQSIRRAKDCYKLVRSGLISKENLDAAVRLNIKADDIESLLRYMTFEKIISYIVKGGHSERTYTDYMRMAEEVGWDINKKDIRFPKDLTKAHNDVMALSSAKKNAEKNVKMKEAADKLLSISYKDDWYIIRPAEKFEELVAESTANNHCVGRSDTYINRMIRGESAIFFVRHASAPETTWFTCEYSRKSHRLIQCRTKNNASYTTCKECMDVLAKWMKKIGEKEIYKDLLAEGATA